MQNWLRNTAPIGHLGVIVGSAGDAPRNYVDGRDVAAVATALLLSQAPAPAEALTLTGPESLTNAGMAERIAQAHHQDGRTGAAGHPPEKSMIDPVRKVPSLVAR